MMQEVVTIASVPCKLHASTAPECLLIQPSARHEEKADGLAREMLMIERAARRGFALAAFDTGNWARALMPWHDDAVSRDGQVGLHARETLLFAEHDLLPWLRRRYGNLPCVIGGYSLGGLFALWAASESAAFDGVAAASPSLWIDGWANYAEGHPIKARHVYMSLGDREEHCRNLRMKRIGDCVRQQHDLMRMQIGDSRTTLEWNHGGHFGEEAERTARAFAWCIGQLPGRTCRQTECETTNKQNL